MIQKFLSIKSVGRFEQYSSVGDIEFRKFNIIYAENGRGKTTLSHIIRSFSSGDTKYIKERNTLGSSDDPHVQVLLDTGKLTLKNGIWDKTFPNVEIFDSTYVNENVFSGHYVDLEHRRNLYLFVIGEKGVKLSESIYELDDQIKDCNTNISDKKSDIKMVILSDFDVEQFVILSKASDIDQQIELKQREVDALEKMEEVVSKPILVEIVLPNVNDRDLLNLLIQQLDDISTDAMQHVQRHISMLGGKAEAWIGDGITLNRDENCPFCGRSTSDVELVKSYQSYFSEGYKNLKSQVSRHTVCVKDFETTK